MFTYLSSRRSRQRYLPRADGDPARRGSQKPEEWSGGDDLVKPIPIGRTATPDEIAPGALFLDSDGASYVTGDLLTIDGAWSID